MFDRQIPIIGIDCQERLKNAMVFIGGVGGLGCSVSEILLRSGVGCLYIADNDTVDITNIHRQILYKTQDIGKPKNVLAKERLDSIGIDCKIEIFGKVNEDFVLPPADVIIDCFDNPTSKIILSKLASKSGIYFIHAGVNSYFGQICTLKDKMLNEVMTFGHSQNNFVITPIVVLMASLISNEAIKLICNKSPTLLNKILTVDLKNYDFDTIELN